CLAVAPSQPIGGRSSRSSSLVRSTIAIATPLSGLAQMEDAIPVERRRTPGWDGEGVGRGLDHGRPAHALAGPDLVLLVDRRVRPAAAPPDGPHILAGRFAVGLLLVGERRLLDLGRPDHDHVRYQVAELR